MVCQSLRTKSHDKQDEELKRRWLRSLLVCFLVLQITLRPSQDIHKYKKEIQIQLWPLSIWCHCISYALCCINNQAEQGTHSTTTVAQSKCKVPRGYTQHQSLSLTEVPERSKFVKAAHNGNYRLHDIILKYLRSPEYITSISFLCSWSSAEIHEFGGRFSSADLVFVTFSASSLVSTGMLRLLLHRSLSHLNNNQILSFQKDMLSLSLGLAPKSTELKWNINRDLD